MENRITNALTTALQSAAQNLGFDLFGVAAASDSALPTAAQGYSTWLEQGFGADMGYLTKHAPIKKDTNLFLENAKSIVCVGLLYGDGELQQYSNDRPLVSNYTRGQDYHLLVKEKLSALAQLFCEKAEGLGSGVKPSVRTFTDAEPVLERFWAWRAGLGWVGKNTCLIHRKLGSYFFLGGFFTDVELTTNAPYTEHCGTCRKCIEACPTEAIIKIPLAEGKERYAVDSNRCIAYHTIENRNAVPVEIQSATGTWVAGCDICQSVCPWNDPHPASTHFKTENPAASASFETLAGWTQADFSGQLKNIAMKRMKYQGFLRNLAIAINNASLPHQQKQALLEKIQKSLASASSSKA